LSESLQYGRHNSSNHGDVIKYQPLSSPQLRWVAAYTKPRHEKRIAEFLQQRRISFFLPMYCSRCKWKDGSKKILELPLFPSYIFINIPLANKVSVLEIPGVLSIVSRGRTPVSLSDQEIEIIRKGLQVSKAEPHPYLVAGERVRMKSGPFTNLEGVLLRKSNGYRVVVTLQDFVRSIVIEVEESDLDHA
jgi:transcription antitermination factor NusG